MSEKRRTFFPLDDKDKVNKPLWWLASYPKSGNTWMRMFLTAYATHGRVDINTAGIVTSDQLLPFYQMGTSKPHTQWTECDVSHLRPSALINMLALYPRRPLYVKTHYANALLDDIPLISPNLTMGATYIIRDPRDVCCSYASHMGKTIDEITDAMCDPTHRNGDNGIHAVVSRWDMHVTSWTTSSLKVGVVKYEDILLDPEGKFTEVVRHMGIPFEKSHIYYGVGASSFESLRAQEEESGFRENTSHQDKFFRIGKSGTWKDVLTKKQAARIEKEFGPTMEKFGYV
jgi:hypothetical protein